MTHDLRLIEDYLPIAEISAEASREKSVRKGHISTLHLWWARRPLVACRAAVYGALVPADRWIKAEALNIKNPPEDPAKLEAMRRNTVRGLNRKQARDFVAGLCRYPSDSKTDEKFAINRAIEQARGHILEAHAARLSADWLEGNKKGKQPAWVAEFKWGGGAAVTVSDIEAGRAPRPRVLDMFAGGGAIPLEALRLGCEAYALDLNPVAHIIQLCTLVYPQKYGRPDVSVRGMTGPANAKGEPTWGGLADEVRYWGNVVLGRVRAEIGDLYPLIPDPEFKRAREGGDSVGVKPVESTIPGRKGKLFDGDDDSADSVDFKAPPGFLMPVAYLWTRTVRCKNPSCGAMVPMLKQSWLCRKGNRMAALRPIAKKGQKRIDFEVVETVEGAPLDFDPSDLSSGGNSTCAFCGSVADAEYVKQQGLARAVGAQLLAVVCRRPGRSGPVFIAGQRLAESVINADAVAARLSHLASRGHKPPMELIPQERPSPNARGLTAPTRHGLVRFADLFHDRQLVSLLTQCDVLQTAVTEIQAAGLSAEVSRALVTYLALVIDRAADRGSSLCRWDPSYTKTQSTFGRPALPFVWDYSETNPFGDASGDLGQAFEWVIEVIKATSALGMPADVRRGSALQLPWADGSMDAIITDPPYYDNVPYGDLSDFFYVWLRRSIGGLYPEHFGTELTPKKSEATALSSRTAGDMKVASRQYEQMMTEAFREAARVLVPGGLLAVVYAHKTTLGWSTLVEALRSSGFIVTEAWPLDTEFGGRLIAIDAAALASSIFLVAKKRDDTAGVGNYEDDVQPELESIVRERVATLWDMGITGADLVISCVGAGLRAFTRFERVEYASGEAVPAEKFLAEVEAVVLDTLMDKLLAGTRRAIAESGEEGSDGNQSGGSAVGGIDHISRFYILWRYLYKAAEMEAGEAIVFANGLHVELDGQGGLSDGKDATLEKKKSKYRLRDFTERGKANAVGLPSGDGAPAPLIDVLHRTLYLMEHRPSALREFLDQARPNRERLRLLAAALAGPGLSGKSDEDAARLVATTPAEQSALGKLLANWKNLVPESIFNAGPKDLFEPGAKR